MTKYLRIFSYIGKPFLIYDFATAPSEFPNTWGKFSFLFYQCSILRDWGIWGVADEVVLNKLLKKNEKTPTDPKLAISFAHTLFRPKTNHTCHQKLNPSRETVPLSSWTYRWSVFRAWAPSPRRTSWSCSSAATSSCWTCSWLSPWTTCPLTGTRKRGEGTSPPSMRLISS